MESQSFDDRKRAVLAQVLNASSDSPLPVEQTLPDLLEQGIDQWMLPGDFQDRQKLATAVREHISVSRKPRGSIVQQEPFEWTPITLN